MANPYSSIVDQVRSERAKLLAEVTKLDLVIETLEGLAGSRNVASASAEISLSGGPPPTSGTGAAANGVLTFSGGATAKKQRRSLRAVVTEMVTAQPLGVTATEITDALIQQGDDRVRPDSADRTSPVRTALANAAGAGDIHKAEDGSWRPGSAEQFAVRTAMQDFIDGSSMRTGLGSGR